MKKRTLFFRIGAIVILLAIAAVMMVIGRGHTVYFDNKKLEYNGETYDTPYKVCVYVGDERVAKLYDKERGMATWIASDFGETCRALLFFGSQSIIKLGECIERICRSCCRNVSYFCCFTP